MRGRVTLFVSCLAAVALMPFVGASDAQDSAELRPPSAFAGMSDQQARSRALFTEAAKVIMNPRCMNCHPASDRPTQGNDMHPHLPQVTRGADGGGVPGNTCGACHMDRNVPIFAGQQTTSLAVVAPGIAEALFATAIGLVAAIPATIFYNKFVSDVNKQAQRLEGFADEFAAILSRQIDERG